MDSFQRRRLSFISEGIEEESLNEESTTFDDRSDSGIRASLYLQQQNNTILEAVQEDDYSRSESGGLSSVTSYKDLLHQHRQQQSLSSSITSQDNLLLRSSTTSMQSSTSTSSKSTQSALIFTQHSLTQVATREINVHDTPYFTEDGELPEEYKDASIYGHALILPPMAKEESIVSSDEEDDYKMLIVVKDKWIERKQMFTSQRKMFAIATILAALFLCVIGIIVAAQVLGVLSTTYSSYAPNYNAEYFYLPRYEFGGGSGGLLGVRDEVKRAENEQYFNAVGFGDERSEGVVTTSEQLAEPSIIRPNAPQLVPDRTDGANPSKIMLVPNLVPKSSSLRSQLSRRGQDPFDGFGPRQFNPMYDVHKPESKAVLTSTALRSYTAPQDSSLAIVLDPLFNGAMMDVSVLPVNSDIETAVFLDIPMTGMARVQYVLGHCLKLVQCSGLGKDLLFREFREAGGSVEEENLLQIPSNFDPPLKADFIQSSKFVNVDCSTSRGIDRGVARDLSSSKMIDSLYTPDIHEAARLFAPPIKAYGRGVVIMRHPIERVVALYEYLRLEGGKDGARGMSLEDFSKSGKCLIISSIVCRDLLSSIVSLELIPPPLHVNERYSQGQSPHTKLIEK